MAKLLAVLVGSVVCLISWTASAAERIGLSPERKAVLEGVATYLQDDIQELKLYADAKGATPALAKAIERLNRNLQTIQQYSYPQAGAVAKTYSGADAFAFYTKAAPGTIYLLDKFFEPCGIQNFDSPEVAKVKMQLWAAERASLLVHELTHAGAVDYRTDTPDRGGFYGGGDTVEVRLRPTIGTGDADAYLVQYYVLRVLTDQSMAEYQRLNNRPYASVLMSMVLSQLRDAGVITVKGDLNKEEVLEAAMKAAEDALALRWGVAIPPTLGRQVAAPVGLSLPAGAKGGTKPAPPAEQGKNAHADPEALEGARLAAALKTVVTQDILARNNNADGSVYRPEFVYGPAYQKKNGQGFIVTAYIMWRKDRDKDREYDVFSMGSAEAPMWYNLGQAAAIVERYNSEHPGAKLEYKVNP